MMLKRVTFVGVDEGTIAAAAQLLALTVKDGLKGVTWETSFGKVRVRSTSRGGWTVHVTPSPVQAFNPRRPPKPFARKKRATRAPQGLPGDTDAGD